AYAAAGALAADLCKDEILDEEQQRERLEQCKLLRDISGNPFRPLSGRTFPPHVVGLAEACYAALPDVTDQFMILADALDDLGENWAAAHCRESLHVKGCHALDWILKKEEVARCLASS